MIAAKTSVISVIIPAYDVATYISDALESVFAQDFCDYEVIVVNDGSNDTAELEQVLQPYSSRLTYLKQENRGVSSARNSALRIASGEFVAFLDADDVWLPNKLSLQLKFLMDGSYDLVYANALFFGNSPWPADTTFMDKSPSNGEVTRESLLNSECAILCSTVLVSRNTVMAAGIFDESIRLAEDFDLWLRILGLKARVGYQRHVVAKYRLRPSSTSSNSTNLHEAGLRVLDKMSRRDDLTSRELEALENTRRELKIKIAIERSKLMILEGKFNVARELLGDAKPIRNRWKISLVRVGLLIFPTLVRRLYRIFRDAPPEPSDTFKAQAPDCEP